MLAFAGVKYLLGLFVDMCIRIGFEKRYDKKAYSILAGEERLDVSGVYLGVLQSEYTESAFNLLLSYTYFLGVSKADYSVAISVPNTTEWLVCLVCCYSA